MKQNTTLASIVQLISTLVWAGVVLAVLFLIQTNLGQYFKMQQVSQKQQRVFGCAQVSKSTYTEKSANWERTTEEPNDRFYNSCLNTIPQE
ncbi:MAG: hypothetical protein ABI425_03650 [Patescibacteria group bacterium]